MSNTFWKSFSVLVSVLFEEDEKSKHSVFMSACKNGDVGIVQLILDCTEFDPSEASMYVEDGDKIRAIQWACRNGHIAVVDRMLQEPTRYVDPSDDDNFAIHIASENGHIAVVDRLLQDDRVKPFSDDNSAFSNACEKGHIAIVERLLQDDRVCITSENNYALRCASVIGHIAVVDRLLQESMKCMPVCDIKEAIRLSSKRGHADIVYLLLQDERILNDVNIDLDWTIDFGWIIKVARQDGYLDIVNILLQFVRSTL